MDKFLTIILAGVLLTPPSSAAMAQPRLDRNVIIVAPHLEAHGCYFYRGRRHCGRYCYIEVNGKRYCREREREDYPQGEAFIGRSVPTPENGLK